MIYQKQKMYKPDYYAVYTNLIWTLLIIH